MQVMRAKTMLELIQDANAAMAKVEDLVGELPAEPAAASPRGELARAKHLERCAGELSRLLFYLTKGAELPLIEALQPRVDAAQAALVAALRACLAATLPSKAGDAENAARRCVHACSLVADMNIAHDTARAALVRPALTAAAEDCGADSATGGGTLGTFLQSAQQRLAPVIERLARLCGDRSEVASSFDFLGTCCLAEVHCAVKERIPTAFATGAPAAFHANYQAAQQFLRWLETQAPSRTSYQQLRNGPHRPAFLKAWNLAVYFSLVFRDIAGALEEQLHRAPAAAEVSKFQRFAFAQSEALLRALARCRDPNVTFAAIYERFFKLQLQLVLRFAAWLQEAQGAEALALRSADGGVAAPDAQNGAQVALGDAQEFGGFDSGGMQEWVAAAETQQLVQLLAEIHRVAEALTQEEVPAIQQQLASAAGDVRSEQVAQVCCRRPHVSAICSC